MARLYKSLITPRRIPYDQNAAIGMLLLCAFESGAKNDGRMQDNDVDRFEDHEKRKFCSRAAGEA